MIRPEDEMKLHIYNEDDLDGLLVAVFDFDATLAVQNKRTSADCNNIRWHGDPYNNENFYIDSHIAPAYMRVFVNKLRKAGVKQFYCLSQMPYSFMLKAKEKFVKKYYGEDFEVLCCGTTEAKLGALEVLKYAKGIGRNDQILLVDDIWATLADARQNGYKTLMPQEVYARFFNIYEDVEDFDIEVYK
jgi:hypothetical protein